MKVSGGRGWVDRMAWAGGGEAPGVFGEGVVAIGGFLGITGGG